MGKVKIFIEGGADKRFIEDYIFHIAKVEIKEDVIGLGGKDTLEVDKTLLEFQKNTDTGGTNLLIFDANGDFKTRQKELLDKQTKLNIKFELFLFPNNKDKGMLEDLLVQIINPKNNKIFECFDGYENCLKGNPDFKIPALKTKVYAYVDTLDKDDEGIANEKKRNYLNKDHWNLDHPSLNPLKDFLLKHIGINPSLF